MEILTSLLDAYLQTHKTMMLSITFQDTPNVHVRPRVSSDSITVVGKGPGKEESCGSELGVMDENPFISACARMYTSNHILVALIPVVDDSRVMRPGQFPWTTGHTENQQGYRRVFAGTNVLYWRHGSATAYTLGRESPLLDHFPLVTY